tara:strand:- start:82 stop:510 length:429 start_codon:yes stop_codon:yes gene_type:complete
MKKLLALLLLFGITGCVTSAFGLDPYTNLNDPNRVNISLSLSDEQSLEKCIHTNWSKESFGVKFPLIVTYNENGKVLSFVGNLNSRFFAIEISKSDEPTYKTKLRTSITSDPTMSKPKSALRKHLIYVLNACGTQSKWTTLY